MTCPCRRSCTLSPLRQSGYHLGCAWLALWRCPLCRAGIILAAALGLVVLLGGCATPVTPAARLDPRPPLITTPATGRAKPAPSATITIIHIRPEARDYVHP